MTGRLGWRRVTIKYKDKYVHALKICLQRYLEMDIHAHAHIQMTATETKQLHEKHIRKHLICGRISDLQQRSSHECVCERDRERERGRERERERQRKRERPRERERMDQQPMSCQSTLQRKMSGLTDSTPNRHITFCRHKTWNDKSV